MPVNSSQNSEQLSSLAKMANFCNIPDFSGFFWEFLKVFRIFKLGQILVFRQYLLIRTPDFAETLPVNSSRNSEQLLSLAKMANFAV